MKYLLILLTAVGMFSCSGVTEHPNGEFTLELINSSGHKIKMLTYDFNGEVANSYEAESELNSVLFSKKKQGRSGSPGSTRYYFDTADSIKVIFDNDKSITYYMKDEFRNDIGRHILSYRYYTYDDKETYTYTFTEEDYNRAD